MRGAARRRREGDPVKVGVLQFFSWPERRVPLETVYARALERIEIMDRTGYDAVWLAEHHFSGFSVCPSVHVMGSHVAARTQKLRIGTAVSLAAFYHPLRLAEEVALLDVLSGGRVLWGAGRGFDRVEFENFGVSLDQSAARFREAVEIVLAAWQNERLHYRGEHFHFDGVEVLPKPLQRPHPPVWVAASSEPAIEWAAEKGHSILMDPHAAHVEIARKHRLYRERLAAHGHAFDGREIPMARLLAVAPTAEKAREVARRGAGWIVGSYMAPAHAMIFDPKGISGLLDIQEPAERSVRGAVIHGTPEMVLDEIARLREELPLEYLMCAPLSHETFTLFTERVLPKLL
jgi:alkanesulfonate monooxygenase SsuD/methylene tetrahydromethanopterin reductase-like flavin-dependent oxidoreductase (luciferase family)